MTGSVSGLPLSMDRKKGKKHMNIQFTVQITVKVRVQEKTIIVTTMHKASDV